MAFPLTEDKLPFLCKQDLPACVPSPYTALQLNQCRFRASEILVVVSRTINKTIYHIYMGVDKRSQIQILEVCSVCLFSTVYYWI